MARGRLAPGVGFAIVRRFIEGFFRHMADDHSHFVHGSMDISAHKRGYEGFLTGVKWTVLLVLGIMIFLAFFRTHNG